VSGRPNFSTPAISSEGHCRPCACYLLKSTGHNTRVIPCQRELQVLVTVTLTSTLTWLEWLLTDDDQKAKGRAIRLVQKYSPHQFVWLFRATLSG
jgi:hypothetical protein